MAHTPHTNFPHHKLDVFHAAKTLVLAARKASDKVPRGYRTFADQLLRSAGAGRGWRSRGLGGSARRHGAGAG